MTVSTQDRVMSALLLGAPPLAIAAVAMAFGAKTVASVFAGIGVAGGVVGAVGAEWFQGQKGPSPLANKGWANGGPIYGGLISGDDVTLMFDANKSVVAAGGEAYDTGLTTNALSGKKTGGVAEQPLYIQKTTSVTRGGVSGIGGFWALR